MLQDVWRFTMLGGWRVQQDGVVLERFRTRKTAALLAYLAYYPHRVQQREQLAELLWPEATPELGLKSLGVALSSLRRLLEPPGVPEATVLVADRYTLQLNPAAIETDIARFDAALRAVKHAPSAEPRRHSLETALDVYAGDLLPGFYEDWVIAERERLGQKYAGALDALATLLEEADELPAAIPHLLRRVQAAPYDEEACCRLMRAYAATGQPDAALGHFEALERRLREEMSAEPGDAIKALVTRIRAALPTKAAGAPPSLLPRRKSFPEGATRPAHAPPPPDAEPAPAREVRLPLVLTRFFGRETERERIAAWLADPTCRLLTLTGPGGSGKTRLAVEAAKRFAGGFDGRILFVPLAGLSAPSQVLDALLNTLGAAPQLPEEPRRTPEQQVVAALSAAGPALLLLDNLEHLLPPPLSPSPNGAEPAASLPTFVSFLLEQVPSLQILATSRQPIGLEGEQEVPVAPLPIPTKPGTPERLLEFASVCLLVDRARLRQPDFQVTPHNAEAVAALCQKLDGIPLAIELAAGWLRVLPPASLLTQLESGLDNLVNRQRSVPERHQTLYAAIEWSYRLLSPELRAFLRRLSIFRGGWTVGAAEAVCAEPRSRELLAELVERSLVVADTEVEIPRYRMLETIRHFLGDQLAESGERGAVRARHLAFFLALAEEAEPYLYATEMAEMDAWMRRLESDQDNLRAALEGSQSVENGTEQAIRLAQAIWLFWRETGYACEARARLAEALTQEGAQGRTRARALDVAGALTLSLAGPITGYPGKAPEARPLYEEARALFEEALVIWRELEDQQGIALAVKGLGVVRAQLGDFAEARALIEECITLQEEMGNRQAIIWAHLDLANMACVQGDHAAARGSMEQALALAREIGYTDGMAILHDNLADLAQDQGDFTTAQRHFREALALYREGGRRRTVHSARTLYRLGWASCEMGDYAAARPPLEEALALCWELGEPRLPYVLVLLARVALNGGEAAAIAIPAPLLAARQEHNERAARLLGAAEAASQALGKSRPVARWQEYERTAETARAALGEEAFAVAWTEGRAMTVEQAVVYAQQDAGNEGAKRLP